jgi:hypothetical protein
MTPNPIQTSWGTIAMSAKIPTISQSPAPDFFLAMTAPLS